MKCVTCNKFFFFAPRLKTLKKIKIKISLWDKKIFECF
jgi:hypothetical protein